MGTLTSYSFSTFGFKLRTGSVSSAFTRKSLSLELEKWNSSRLFRRRGVYISCRELRFRCCSGSGGNSNYDEESSSNSSKESNATTTAPREEDDERRSNEFQSEKASASVSSRVWNFLYTFK